MIDRFFRIKTQHAYVALQERTINYLSESAVERYKKFVKQYREVEQSIPQYMLASYLGVNPRTFKYYPKKYGSINVLLRYLNVLSFHGNQLCIS